MDAKTFFDGLGCFAIVVGGALGLIKYRQQCNDTKANYFSQILKDVSKSNFSMMQKNALFRLRSFYNDTQWNFLSLKKVYPYRLDIIRIITNVLKEDHTQHSKNSNIWFDICQTAFNLLINFYSADPPSFERLSQKIDFRFSYLNRAFPTELVALRSLENNEKNKKNSDKDKKKNGDKNFILVLKKIILCESKIIDSNLCNIDFSGSDFNGTSVINTKLWNTDFSRTRLHETSFYAEFNCAKLINLETSEKTFFCHCNFFKSEFKKDKENMVRQKQKDIFKGITFVCCNFEETLFEAMHFKECNFFGCTFKDIRQDNIKGKLTFDYCMFLNCHFKDSVSFKEKITEDSRSLILFVFDETVTASINLSANFSDKILSELSEINWETKHNRPLCQEVEDNFDRNFCEKKISFFKELMKIADEHLINGRIEVSRLKELMESPVSELNGVELNGVVH